jgi:hypothetical protein
MDQQSRVYYQGQRMGFADGVLDEACEKTEPSLTQLYARSLKESHAFVAIGSEDHWAAGYRLGYRRGYGGSLLPVECLSAPPPPPPAVWQAIEVGSRVEAGDGEDYDTGVVLSFSGPIGRTAHVAWDSGVRTAIHVSELRHTTARYSDGHWQDAAKRLQGGVGMRERT